MYDGEATVPFGDRLHGVPVRRLFGGSEMAVEAG